MVGRDRLVDQILDHLQLVASEIDALSGVAAGFIGLNRTDLRAVQVLRVSGGLTAGELARALRITSGATTRVIDSLAGSGYARRDPDRDDRRRVLVRLTPEAERTFDRSFERLRDQTRSVLDTYAVADLETVARFLADVRSLMRASR